jgi:hypothetical protein
MRTRTLVVLALAALAGAGLAGCAARRPRLEYRLIRINGVPAIAPPGYAEGARETRVTVPAAAANRPAGECSLALGSFQASPAAQGAFAVRVDLEALFPEGAYDEVAREAFLSFRRELEILEERKHCLLPGAARLVAERVAEALPVPFQDVAFYRNGYNALGGYVDLAPGERAFQQSLAASDGTFAQTDALGYEFTARAGSDGTSVRATGGHPELSFVRWDEAAAFHHRLFLRTRFLHQASAKPELHAVLLAAPDLAALAELTRSKDPEDACAEAAGKVPCVIFPNRLTVGPQILVAARGKPAWVDITASAGELPRRAGAKAPRLKLRRLFAGKLVPVNLTGAGPLALRVPLVAGDELKWQ